MVVCDVTSCILVRKHQCICACCLHLQNGKCFAQSLYFITSDTTRPRSSHPSQLEPQIPFVIPSTSMPSEFSIFVKFSTQIFRSPPTNYVLYVLPILIKSSQQHCMRNTCTNIEAFWKI